MPTIIRSDLFDKGLEVTEGYETIKKRLFQAGDFIEATVKSGKIILNKQVIKACAPKLTEGKISALKKEGATMIPAGQVAGQRKITEEKKTKGPKVTTKVNEKGGKETFIGETE